MFGWAVPLLGGLGSERQGVRERGWEREWVRQQREKLNLEQGSEDRVVCVALNVVVSIVFVCSHSLGILSALLPSHPMHYFSFLAV